MNASANGPTEEVKAKVANRWWGLAVISLAQLMVTLDTTIVVVALPSAQEAVGLTDFSRQWVVTAYALAFGGLLLLGGRVGDLLGRQRALVIGVAVFAAASGLGGAAINAEMLISARALQGMFAALIAPATLSLISTTFTDPRERSKAFGVFTVTMMSGGATGLILGGVLTSYLNWRWCMYVNIPIAAAILIGALMVLPSPASRAKVILDVPGAILGSAGMLALIYGLGQAGLYGWGSGLIIGSLVIAVVLLTAFVVVQLKVANPLLPLRVLTNRNSGGSLLAMVISAFCMLGMFLGMTYQLQSVMNYSPLKAGLAFVAYVGTAAIYSSQIASKLLRTVRPGTMITVGLIISAIGLLLLTRLTPDSSYLTDIFPALVLFGLGVGNLAVPIFSTAMSSNQASDAGIVSAVVNTSQQIGGSIGTALLNTISAGAAAAYLATNGAGAAGEANAAVHGLAVACTWAAAVALAGAVMAGVLINANPRRPAPAAKDAPERTNVASE